jgi:hypothetical protein
MSELGRLLVSFSESPCSLAHRLHFLPRLFRNLLYYLFCFGISHFYLIWVEGIVDDYGAVRLEIRRVEFGIAGITMYLMVLKFRYLVVCSRLYSETWGNFHQLYIRY